MGSRLRRAPSVWRVELFTIPLLKEGFAGYFKSFTDSDLERFTDRLIENFKRGKGYYIRHIDLYRSAERLFWGFFDSGVRKGFRDLFDVYREVALNLFEFNGEFITLRKNRWKSYFLCEEEDVPFLWKFLDLMSLRDFWIALVAVGHGISAEGLRLFPFPREFQRFIRSERFYELHSHAGSFTHTKELWLNLLLAASRRNPLFFERRNCGSEEERNLLNLALEGYAYKLLLLRGVPGRIDLERDELRELLIFALSEPPLEEEEILRERSFIAENLEERESLPLLYLYLRARTEFHRRLVFFSKEGLQEFINLFRQARSLGSLTQIKSLTLTGRRGFSPPEEGVRTYYEMRFSPSALKRKAYEDRETFRRSLSLTIHLLKRRERTDNNSLSPPFDRISSEYRRIRTGYSYFPIMALDVASHEVELPNFLFLPAYEDFNLLALSQKRKVHFTFHAGEEFDSPFQGLRHVTEYLLFFPVKSGDRIGHGSALAYSLDLFLKRERGEEIGALDFLFNLVLEWFLRVSGKLSTKQGLIPKLEFAIRNVAYEIFRGYAINDVEIGLWTDPHSLWKVYRSFFDPIFFLEKAFELGSSTNVSIVYNSLLSAGKKVYSRRFPHNFGFQRFTESEEELFDTIYLSYFKLNKPDMFTFSEVGVGDERYRFETWQMWLRREVKRRGLFVEVCPTSNFLIVGFESMVEHPVVELPEWIDVVVSTDNYLQTNSTVLEEVGLTYYTLREVFGRRRAWNRTRELLRNAGRAYFGGAN